MPPYDYELAISSDGQALLIALLSKRDRHRETDLGSPLKFTAALACNSLKDSR